ncbi:MAG: peptidylprolyl isomerase [Rickettsiales bacterium]|nr:peptidylprolyl isomerase [Rickettsiales bacterium]
MEQKAKSLVSDAQLKAAYDQKVAAAKNEEEVKARHILIAVPSPSENEKALATAKDIVEQLKKGADFDKLAKEKSDDKGSGAQGGDLGWFTKGKMVAAFADAAFKLKKGEISEPVKSDFGWHIIKVEDRRAAKVPSFEELKESLQAEVTRKAVQTYLEGLLKSADIKYYSADGSQKELSRSLSPAAAGAAGAAATPAEKK